MGKITVTIPDDTDASIMRLVDDGEFMSREDAVQSLISTGLTAHRTGTDGSTDTFDYETELNDDPLGESGDEDPYAF